MSKYFYIAYMVHNNIHSTIIGSDTPETIFSDVTAKYNSLHGHAVCIICAHETTREDWLNWEELTDIWEVKK